MFFVHELKDFNFFCEIVLSEHLFGNASTHGVGGGWRGDGRDCLVI